MAKEPVDFIFKADTKQIDKAMSDVASRLEKLGKGVKLKLGGFDAQSLIASVKSVQDILQKCNEAASNSDLSPAIGEVSGLMTAVQKLTDSLDAMEKAAGDVDLSKTFTDSLPSIQAFSAELRKVLDALSGIQGSVSSFALALNVPERERLPKRIRKDDGNSTETTSGLVTGADLWENKATSTRTPAKTSMPHGTVRPAILATGQVVPPEKTSWIRTDVRSNGMTGRQRGRRNLKDRWSGSAVTWSLTRAI